MLGLPLAATATTDVDVTGKNYTLVVVVLVLRPPVETDARDGETLTATGG